MRDACSISSLRRKALGLVLAGGTCCCGGGCQHHHYYYYGGQGAGPCPPGTVVPSTVAGPVCEVPSSVDGGTAVSSRSTIIENGRKSRVVVSEPSQSSRSSRFGWRSADLDDPPAITHVEGALDDTTVK